jgi:hypothetical protein
MRTLLFVTALSMVPVGCSTTERKDESSTDSPCAQKVIKNRRESEIKYRSLYDIDHPVAVLCSDCKMGPRQECVYGGPLPREKWLRVERRAFDTEAGSSWNCYPDKEGKEKP